MFKRLVTWWSRCNKKNKSAGDLKVLYNNNYTLFEDGKRPPKPGHPHDDNNTSKSNCYDGKQDDRRNKRKRSGKSNKYLSQRSRRSKHQYDSDESDGGSVSSRDSV